MNTTAGLASLAFTLALATPPALAQAPVKTANGILVNSTGMTLYTFDKDEPGKGKSACAGPCATNWPPLIARTGAQEDGDYSTVLREDGGKQWAYKGKPLYMWAKDRKPGDVTGDGLNEVWHVAKP